VLLSPDGGVCASGAAWAPGAEVSGTTRMTPSPAGLPSQVIDVPEARFPFSLDCTGQARSPGADVAVGSPERGDVTRALVSCLVGSGRDREQAAQFANSAEALARHPAR